MRQGRLNPAANLPGKPRRRLWQQRLVWPHSAAMPGPNELILRRCRAYGEGMEAAQDLQARCCVVLQLDRMEPAQAQRLSDFLAGAAAALDGRLEWIGAHTLLLAPALVRMSDQD